MRIKIISDGTHRGTRVVNAETGERIEGVISITWHLDLGKFYPDIEIKLQGHAVEVELEGPLP